jgi:hypothetical protein
MGTVKLGSSTPSSPISSVRDRDSRRAAIQSGHLRRLSKVPEVLVRDVETN